MKVKVISLPYIFPGFVCLVLYLANISGERLQDHWSSGYFLVPESFHKNLVQIGKVVSEKIQFEFLYVHDLGPRSRNDLDL